MKTLKLRPSVLRFAEQMERNLRKHDKGRGRRGWINDNPWTLAGRVDQELAELRDELPTYTRQGNASNAYKEAADVANMAMMTAETAERVCRGKSWGGDDE